MEKEQYKLLLPETLYKEIEDIYNSFLEIQKEASGIIHHTQMPNATAHLQDVLEATEKATNTILDSATNIQIISDQENVPDEIKQQIGEIVTKIYEACTFQDVTGQRIKKVLNNIGALEDKIIKIMKSAKVYVSNNETVAAEKPTLMNGPQLTSETPSQDDIDKLFGS